MKLVTAIIQPEKTDQITQALGSFGVQGMTISQASGYGRQRGRTQVYRGAEYTVDALPKVRVEVLVPEEDCDEILGVLILSANTGTAGDGKIWVTNVEEVIRIRTGERGKLAV
ncbi:P-II family nitrogen regulator [Paeniglutamicibacter antarcticus]|uniref:Nitrogen regulatory protein P-II n=1 Tax=Paeniglutamicibacter antarcticus TaxID=494023 RepID=A0ABP9THI9_9MICC